ncbi:MAG TPA: GNAT family N-acetyltransferase [Candidatus Binatia bacterium]|jgi:GNAT superfamily N-acetyltransferase
MALNVVRVEPTDLDPVVEIIEDARQWLLSRGINQWPKPMTKDWLANITRGHEVYLASADGVDVATVTIQWSDEQIWGEMPDNAGYIHQLAVRDRFHGRQTGLQLLGWAEKRIGSLNKRFARLDCWSENTKLCVYYENAGYVLRRGTTRYGRSFNLYEKEIGS